MIVSFHRVVSATYLFPQKRLACVKHASPDLELGVVGMGRGQGKSLYSSYIHSGMARSSYARLWTVRNIHRLPQYESIVES